MCIYIYTYSFIYLPENKKTHIVSAGFLTLLTLCTCKASFHMHLKLLGDTAGVVISFFSHLQSKGQTIPKAISSPVILARHLQQKAVSNQVLSHLMYTKARHQTEQPACKLLLSPIMSCSQSEQKNAVCFSTC